MYHTEADSRMYHWQQCITMVIGWLRLYPFARNGYWLDFAALSTLRRLALSTLRRLALSTLRRLALSTLRRLALSTLRRLALSTLRRLALSTLRRLALSTLRRLVLRLWLIRWYADYYAICCSL